MSKTESYKIYILTPTLSGLEIVYAVGMCLNEFKDTKEKSWS